MSVTTKTEMIHEARIIPLDGRPHLPAELRRWQGDSRARWEGDSLVIDTTNFNDKTATFLIPGGPLVTEATREARPNAPKGYVGSAENLRLTHLQEVPDRIRALSAGLSCKQGMIRFEALGDGPKRTLDRAPFLRFPGDLDQPRVVQGVDMSVEPGNALTELCRQLFRGLFAFSEGLQ